MPSFATSIFTCTPQLILLVVADNDYKNLTFMVFVIAHKNFDYRWCDMKLIYTWLYILIYIWFYYDIWFE